MCRVNLHSLNESHLPFSERTRLKRRVWSVRSDAARPLARTLASDVRPPAAAMGVVHLPSLTPSPRTEKASRVPPRRGRAAIARLAAAAAAPQKTTLAEEWHSVLQNPPLRLGEIQQRAFQRNGVAAALSARARTRVFEPATVDDISAYHMHALHIPLDAEQRRSLLWGEFQHGITQRRDPAAGGSTGAHEPRPPVQRALRRS